jgi:hypothetical protein
MSRLPTAADRVRQVLARGPLYEGLMPLVANLEPAQARRALLYLHARGEAVNDHGSWSLIDRNAK